MEWQPNQFRKDPGRGPASAFVRSDGDKTEMQADPGSPHVLVVEDDQQMRNMIIDHFRDNNLRATGAANAREASRHLSAEGLSLIVLDLKLGNEDGFNMLREIRARSDVPVVIVTGHRRDEIDRIIGLELGADDYLTKPFSLRELLARARAILRRQEIGRTAQQRSPERGGFIFGGWRMERRTRRLIDPAGAPIPLTKGEYALLIAFLEAPQRPLSREYLLQATRIHEDVFDRSIDVQVLRLRRKLEADPADPRVIQTERGFGYMFTLPVEPI
jgi:two-component system OmpR family response regulator